MATALHPAVAACQKGYVSQTKSTDGQSYPRLELDQFCQDEKRLNLFLLALSERQQNVNLEDQWAWFSFGAIHGIPGIGIGSVTSKSLYNELKRTGHFQAEAREMSMGAVWGILPVKPTSGDTTGQYGYCVHGSVLFPSWHRSFTLYVEQSIQAKMVEIAARFQDPALRAVYQRIADRFRYPYWDMFKIRKRHPDGSVSAGLSYILAVPDIRVRKPPLGDTLVTIPNPLYRYSYPTFAQLSSAPSRFGPADWRKLVHATTHRQDPVASTDLPKMDNNNYTQSRFSDHDFLQTRFVTVANPDNTFNPASDPIPWAGSGMRAKLYASLTSGGNANPDYAKSAYQIFSASAFAGSVNWGTAKPTKTPDMNEPRSLEGFHNAVHALCTGDRSTRFGSMDPPQMAGYDPIFHVFHGFVDHCYSLFLAAWPNVWWQEDTPPSATIDPSYTAKMGLLETPTTPLMPFRTRPVGHFWERGLGKNYMTPNDTRKASDWSYHYSSIGPDNVDTGNLAARAAAYINQRFLWIKPTAGHLEDWLNVADSGVPGSDRQTVFSLEGTEAFIPAPGPNPWPPLIDDKVAPVDLYPAPGPAPVPAPPAPPVVPIVIPGPPVGPDPVMGEFGDGSDVIPTEHAVGPTTVSTMSEERMKPIMHSVRAAPSARLTNGVNGGDHETVPRVTANAQATGETKPQRSDEATPQPNGETEPQRAEERLTYDLPPHVLKNDNEIQNWSFQFVGERQKLFSPFDVYVFVGDFPEDQSGWSECPNLAGWCHNFLVESPHRVNRGYANAGDSPTHPPQEGIDFPPNACENCARQEENKTTFADFVPLTPILLDYVLKRRVASTDVPEAEARLASLDQEHVIPFLKRHLHWRYVRSDGVQIYREDMDGYRAWVHDEVMMLPTKWTELASYKDHDIQYEITDSRPGGLNHGEHPLIGVHPS